MSPGGLVTSLVADTDRQTSKVTAEATKVKKVAVDTVSVPRQTIERDSSRSLFIGEENDNSFCLVFHCNQVKLALLEKWLANLR